MPESREEVRILAFDPGGVTGWAFMSFHIRAFQRPKAKLLSNLLHWKTGNLMGEEINQVERMSGLIDQARFAPMPYVCYNTFFISEGFQLGQLIGGDELLSPVRINSMLRWDLHRRGLTLIEAPRQLRTNITKDRLKLWKLWPVRGKDAFAAMQHAVAFSRRLKRDCTERKVMLT